MHTWKVIWLDFSYEKRKSLVQAETNREAIEEIIEDEDECMKIVGALLVD